MEATAIFGGSFDPAHEGHLAVVEKLLGMGYANVWLMLTPQNPDKPDATVPYGHRRALLQLLLDGVHNAAFRRRVAISDFEAGMTVKHEKVRTFTLLTHLKRVFAETSFTFVVGADCWADPKRGIHTWGHFEELLDLASFLVLPRDPWTDLMDTCPATQALGHRRDTTSPLGVVKPGCWGLAEGMVEHQASSTAIKNALPTGNGDHLNDAQRAYIREHRLYGVC